ncbi:MAG: leucine-rich repeat protein, partial [Alistipes sp.]|nr:leucine-rich repeat protein [Alistipes sp.]
MDAIEASLPKLHNTATKARALVSEQISETRGDDDNGVKTMIEALEERVAALEEYIAGGGEGSWMDTTYATLDMYEETIALLAELQAEIDVLKGQNDAKYEDVLDSIEKSVNSMKAWVNELLTGYYDIATIDAMFAKLLEGLSADDAAIRSEIEALRKELDKQFDDMEDAYRDAIREAIEENNGGLSEQLTKEIEAVNSRIDDEVEKLNKRLDDIEERLSKLEDSVSDLLKRIQSITYIPLYDDNTARVLCPNEGLEGSTVQLDFTISPRDAAEDLAAVWQEAVSVKALYTGSPVMIDLPVVSCTAYADQGLLSVVAACDNLSWEFYNDDVKARAIMYISDGNNDLASEYIPLIPQRSQIPNNQIWYTVTGKTPIDIQQGYGPKIVSNTFGQSKDIYIVTFEEDIYSIPADYFGGKVELRRVVLPNSISSIDDYAFSGCYNLSDISLGLSLGYIGSRAFEGCAIHTLNLPASLYGVNSEAFAGSSIVQLAGDMVADDGISLIFDNTLVAITPAGIGTEYGVPTEAITIGDGVFRDFSGLEHINIHNKITSIGYEAFKNCGSLTSIAIPDSVESIGDGIFAGCTSLKSLSLGVNIESINKEMFTGCDSIEQFSGKFASEDGSALIYNGTLMVFAKACCVQKYTIPANVTHIEERVFANCSNISLFRFESTTPPTLGEGVFDGIENLQISIPKEAVEAYLTCDWPHDYRRAIIELADINNIPDSCRLDYTTNDNQKLGVYPEDGYTVLSHNYSNGQGIIVFFERLTTIGENAFYDCDSLTSMNIPNSVTSIGDYAFCGCDSLKSVNIPDSVTTIGEYAFVDCRGLTSATIGDSVTTIGEYAFANCQGLTSATIGDSVTTIGEYAFAYCFNLTSVNIPNSVTTIGEYAFYNCFSLTSITIPESVVSIEGCAFENCSSLTSITILEGVTSIGERAFSGCSSLTSITIPEGVNSIGASTFSGCSSLTSITIPKGVTSIGKSAFSGCSSLTSITIPEGVTSIGARAFSACSSLTSITIP